MRIVSLRVKGFRVFAEEQFIEFPRHGLILIQGLSGAGKSSIMQAIGFALGYSTFAASKQQSWFSDESMQIDLKLAGEEEGLLIRRGKVNQIEHETFNGNEVVAKGATEVAKWLQNFFGVDPAMLRAMTFQPQRSRGAFLTMKNDQRRAFLTSVLGLQKYEGGLKKIKEDANSAFNACQAKMTAIDALQSSLPVVAPLQEQILRITDIPGLDPEANYAEVDLEALFAPLNMKLGHTKGAILQNLDTMREAATAFEENRMATARKIRDLCAEHIASLEGQARATEAQIQDAQIVAGDGVLEGRLQRVKEKLVELESEETECAKRWREAVRKVGNCHSDLAAAIGKNRDQQKILDAMLAGICPTCNQTWHKGDIAGEKQKNDDWLLAVQRQEEAVKWAEAVVVEAEGATTAVGQQKAKFLGLRQTIEKELAADFERRRGEALEQSKAAAAARASIRFALDEQRSRLNAEARLEAETVTQQISAQIVSIRTEIQAQEAELQRVNVTGMALQKRCIEAAAAQKIMKAEKAAYETQRAARGAAKARIAAMRADAADLEAQSAELEDLQAATKAFLSVINDEILSEIAEATNEFLGELPNTKDVRVAFRTERLTDAGDLKSEIKAVVSIGDQEDIDTESQISGGQQTALELAVDRAVATVLRRRRGGSRLPSWVTLDEAFDGLGAAREACVGILQRMAADSQVVVIDHASEFKAIFDQVISVTAGTRGSAVSVENNMQ